ncbi:MAG: NAD(P)-binding domain-containing protein [Chloroflexi bacterium]|nr:NAD(P)-binding domain-containing protein [Chloroflexota bacterium]
MNVTILGTGNMARAIATRMLAGGNDVTLLSRDPEDRSSLVQALAPAAAKGARVHISVLGSPLADPVVISALWYPGVLEVIKTYGSQLGGKVLVDISNPLNQSFDDLATPPGSSAAEEIARVAPKDARVVKAFNTTFAGLLTQGQVGSQSLDVLMAGDDERAKTTLAELITAGGQRPIDTGPLSRARQLEALGLLLITLQPRSTKPWMNAFKLVD